MSCKDIPEDQRESFERFSALVKRRWETGNVEYEGRSYSKVLRKLTAEIKEEIADIAGWAPILFKRVEDLEAQLAAIERVSEMIHGRVTVVADAGTHLRDLCEGLRDISNTEVDS